MKIINNYLTEKTFELNKVKKFFPLKEAIIMMKSSSISINKICPYCQQKVCGNQIKIDDEGNIYHVPCIEKGTIGKIQSKKIIVKPLVKKDICCCKDEPVQSGKVGVWK